MQGKRSALESEPSSYCRAEILPKEQTGGKKENGQAPAKKPKLATNGTSMERETKAADTPERTSPIVEVPEAAPKPESSPAPAPPVEVPAP